MALTLFNSLGRRKEVFAPIRGKTVRLYTCGPTVYKSQHIGNYRTYIFEDILKRVLALNGFLVSHVMNITDVGHLVSDDDEGEDKVERAAKREHKSAFNIARFYEREFKKDLTTLHILPPKRFVRATDHIKEQIALIKILEKRGVTYRTSDGVYFDTSKVKNYGTLALRERSRIRAGARVSTGEKRNATDFALWKFSPPKKKRQMEWLSPWGIGFPGWHTECSAMSMKYLGSTLDIHCGGIDHREIHHPNEIAQSETATGKPFSRFWMHGTFLTVRGEKMAKSSPETNITLKVLKDRGFDPLDFRYLTLGTHYRKPISFSWEALRGARNARMKLTTAYSSFPIKKIKEEAVLKTALLYALNDDLNTPRALAVLWKGVGVGASRGFALWADLVFGLLAKTKKHTGLFPRDIRALVAVRERFRHERKWREADRLRAELYKKGFRLEDTASGPLIHRL